MTQLIERIEKLWCETMHSRTMWPIHGKYRCAEWLREYPAIIDTEFAPALRSDVPPEFLRVASAHSAPPR